MQHNILGGLSGGHKQDTAAKYELILAIVDYGNSALLMDIARAAGARGGTILNARGTANPQDEKFFGISLQPEKEMIMIITPKEEKKALMNAITENFGGGTDAHGVVFSIPLDDCSLAH